MIYTILTLPTVPEAVTVLNEFNESHGLSNDFYWIGPDEPNEENLSANLTSRKMSPIDGFRCEVKVPGTTLDHFTELLGLFEARGFPLLVQESNVGRRNQAPEDRQLKSTGVFYTDKGQVINIDVADEDFSIPIAGINPDDLCIPEALKAFQDLVRNLQEKTAIPTFENQIEYGKRARMSKLISSF